MEGLSDDDIIKALKPSYSNKDLNDAMNQSKQDIPEDNVLEEINKIHSGPDLPSPETEEESEELLEEAPLPEDSGEEIQTQQQEYPSYGVQSSMSNDQMQQVIEAVVEEKWEDLISKVGDLNLWKESVNNDLEAVKQEILRTQERLSNLQNIMVGKVGDYSKNINDISTEMKALEQVMQRILQPLVMNIKDLNKVTQELKSHKRHVVSNSKKSKKK